MTDVCKNLWFLQPSKMPCILEMFVERSSTTVRNAERFGHVYGTEFHNRMEAELPYMFAEQSSATV